MYAIRSYYVLEKLQKEAENKSQVILAGAESKADLMLKKARETATGIIKEAQDKSVDILKSAKLEGYEQGQKASRNDAESVITSYSIHYTKLYDLAHPGLRHSRRPNNADRRRGNNRAQ